MKRSLRAFGIGIFLVGVAWTLYDEFFAPSESAQIEKLQNQLAKSEEQIATLEKQLSNNGEDEKATTKQEEAKQTASSAQQVKTDKPDEKKQTASPSKKTNDVAGIVYVYEGVSLYDIGKQVEDLGIIENGRELELYLYKPEYARSIQKGQFELNSSMTLEEMANILTGKQ